MINNSTKKIKDILSGTPIFPVPKGELWLGTDFLKQAGFDDTLENHFRMAEKLDHDMICLPISEVHTGNPSLGYRYFQCDELNHAVRFSNRFVAAVVDGPFQSMVNNLGLMEVLTGWFRDLSGMVRAYDREKEKSLDLISQCLTRGAHAIVITDDLAADQGPLISPVDIERVCSPFYLKAIKDIHGAERYAFLHSCGRVTRLTELIKAWNFDGLAAVQHSANNLFDLRKALGSRCVIMAGIDADLLASDTPGASLVSEFERLVRLLALDGGLILSSACGLYDGVFLERISHLYRIADQVS